MQQCIQQLINRTYSNSHCFYYSKESVTYDEATHYRDSFIEVMNEIKDFVQSNDSV